MKIALIIVCVLMFILSFTSSKTKVWKICKDHIKTLYNAETGKIYWWDLIVFFCFPLALSLILVLYFRLDIENYVGTLITVFSILCGLLFNFLVLILGTSKKDANSWFNKVLNETYSNISYEILVSLLCVILLCVFEYVTLSWLSIVINIAIVFLSINFVFTIFMVLKRVYSLLDNKNN